jgi:glycosyltransferase involved in cell wall biosynthesis
MKVLNCILENRFGGPHRRNLSIAERLSKQGIETLFLIGHKSEDPFASESFTCFSLKRLQCVERTRPLSSALLFLVFLPCNVIAVCRIIKRHRIDMVHINGLLNVVPALAAALLRKPVLWHCNDGGLPNIVVKASLPCIALLADRCIVQGRKIGEQLFGRKHRLWKKTEIVYPPVDTERFCRDSVDPLKAEQLRKQLHLNPERICIGTVGNINPCKGVEHFIRAAAIVREKVDNAVFLIVGKKLETQRQYEASLHELITALKLEDAVVFAGFIEAMPEMYSLFDVFVLSSVRESCPNALLEALSMSVPAVATDVGSVTELLDPLSLESVVEPGDPRAIARRILRLLETPDNNSAEQTRRARSRVEERFAVDIIADTQRRIYESLVQSHTEKRTPRP